MVSVSFIISTFNSSSFIKRCLDSIFSQEFVLPSFEVIVVDDASTDNTVEILKRYASLHKQILLMCEPENQRLGSTRNHALAIAKGKFIAFVDSDDEVASGITSALIMAEERDLDMVAMCFAKISTDGVIEEDRLPFSAGEVFSGIDTQSRYPFYRGSVWRYIYNKVFLDSVRYPFAEGVLYEDMDFLCVHLYRAKRMSYCDECAYRYHVNPWSITHNITYKNLCDYALLGTRMLRVYESLNDKTAYYANLILEGGSYNIKKAFSKLPKLKSRLEVRAFYDRLDSYFDRKKLFKYHKPAYCWDWWTRFCLRHRKMAITITGLAISLVKIIKR